MLRITRGRFYLVPILMRTLDLLEFLGRSSIPLKTGEIANATGVPQTTTYRILRTLVHRGYVAQDLEGRFSALGLPAKNPSSPSCANTSSARDRKSGSSELSGDQVIDVMDSFLQALRDRNGSSLDGGINQVIDWKRPAAVGELISGSFEGLRRRKDDTSSQPPQKARRVARVTGTPKFTDTEAGRLRTNGSDL